THKDVRVKVSHRVVAGQLVQALGVDASRVPAAFDLLDRRDKLEPDEFKQRAADLGLDEARLAEFNAAVRACVPCTDGAGVPTALGGFAWCAKLPVEQGAALAALQSALIAAGLGPWCDFDLGIVRGLAYYTGTVFEIHEASGAERAIAGGGRYDGLIEMFGGPPTPAMGFGMGDVVLGLVLAERGLLPKDGAELLPRPDAFVISAGDEAAELELPRLVARLRGAGLHVRHSYKATRNVGKLLGDASKQRARCAIILGPELAQGAVQLKNLATGEQRMVPCAAVTDEVTRLKSGGASEETASANPRLAP
ncbi:MAG: ATP phosphoribosyltransferase regulatory subunit, partial [Phycisphaerae bacterium]|nr:ATP phosphoribosyltransferase regulatory subunit [Phycisphaerae bacterium]